ncbi:MAG: hypothetical protein HYZ37_09375 [Candidatus Solibacter usitatus]|nr:hypothetical protein [Candidatus Solibacter usitatus]
MKRLLACCLFTLLAAAQENPLLKTGGRQIKNVNPDDARLLGILARGLAYEAEKKGQTTETSKALFAAATAAFQKEDWNRAWRLTARLNTLLIGEAPGEEMEVAASVDIQLNKRIVSGDSLTLFVRPLYVPDPAPTKKYMVKLSLKDSSGNVHKTTTVPIEQIPESGHTLDAAQAPEGHFFIEFELLCEGKTLTSAVRDVYSVPTLRSRLDALRPKLEKVKSVELKTAGMRAAAESAEYITTLLTRLTREYVADMNKVTHPFAVKMGGSRLTGYTSDMFKLPQDLDFAESLIDALLVGKDILATRSGDMRMAHRSSIDKTLQPFRVFVPEGFDPKKQYPLIVGLHGATGDENTYMDRYNSADGTSLFKRLAQERGYIVVTPNGRGPYGMYLDNSEKDVMEVLERVAALYPIRKDQVFLCGHSMGGGGTWHVGFSHPDRFRALAPVASGFGGRVQGLPSVPLKNAAEMPVLFSYGLKDTLATPENSKRIIAYSKTILKNFESREFPDDHFAIGVSSMQHIFDFFDRFREKAQ